MREYLLDSKKNIAQFLIFLVLMAAPGWVSAASYSKLTSQGYTTGKLTKNKAGKLGWYVTSSKKRYFCGMGIATVYVGKNRMLSFTSSGRRISIDRNTYESRTGGYNKNIPQLRDIESGKLKPSYVKSCRVTK